MLLSTARETQCGGRIMECLLGIFLLWLRGDGGLCCGVTSLDPGSFRLLPRDISAADFSSAVSSGYAVHTLCYLAMSSSRLAKCKVSSDGAPSILHKSTNSTNRLIFC